jgi:DNA ligase 1
LREFAQLFVEIDETNKTNAKVEAMARYFASAPPEDAAWVVAFLSGRRPRRPVTTTQLWQWAQELSGIPGWLFSECYDAVGDLAEHIALILPQDLPSPNHPLAHLGERREGDQHGLARWVEGHLLQLAQKDDEEKRAQVIAAWSVLLPVERFVYNKMITGEMRVGVSQDLVVRALSQASSIDVPVIAHRLMGNWEPNADFYRSLFAVDGGDTDISRPYPFCLAHPIAEDPSELGDLRLWQVEWKFDGIRAQLVRRQGQTFLWSSGEELINDRFPEIVRASASLPDGTVLDGEIMGWKHGRPLPFGELQKRIGRKAVGAKLLQEVPAALICFDILEMEGQDLRERPLAERRAALQSIVSDAEKDLCLAGTITAESWEELAEIRARSREENVEGLMIKRIDSPYVVGRKRGFWWKWKIDPYTVDAVLIYAARGSGRRASLYTDYTFGIWKDDELVPFAKAYSGLDDEEIREVDSFVRANTLEKFGPVRTVKAELVFELAFEGIQLSKRHKSGIAVRFPRISRWRKDKKPADADTYETVRALLPE